MSWTLSKPDYWTETTLGEVLSRADERINPSEHPDESFFYVGLEHIESNTGRLVNPALVTGRDLRSTKNVFRSGEILFGRLRPNLNKVHFAKKGGICSTDIWVLQARPGLEAEFAAYYLRSNAVLGRVEQLSVGAHLPRIHSSAFDAIPILLPPLPEQHRIVDILRLSDKVRALRRDASQRIQDLFPALFYRVFGNPATNPMKWELINLDEVIIGTPQNGLYKHSSYYGSGTPIIRIGDFYEGRLRPHDTFRRLQTTAEEVSRYRVKDGDVLINRVNSPEFLGKSALVEGISEDTVFESNMMRLTIDKEKASPEYVVAFLNTGFAKHQIMRRAKRAINQASINQQDVMSLELPLPSQAALNRYQSVLLSATHLYEAGTRSEELVNSICESQLAYAFTGELTATWREEHAKELQEAAAERDRLLGLEEERPVPIKLDISTESGREAFEFQLQSILEPAAKQLATAASSMSALMSALQSGPLVELAQQMQQVTERSQALVDASIWRVMQEATDSVRQSLAVNLEPLQQATASIVAMGGLQDDIQRLSLKWAEQLARTAAAVLRRPDSSHRRYALLAELSHDQYLTYLAVRSAPIYITATSLEEEIGFSAKRLEQVLELLTAAGLIQSVGILTEPPDGSAPCYIRTYRRLADTEDSGADDQAHLKELLRQESAR